jgi:hypothetical protein
MRLTRLGEDVVRAVRFARGTLDGKPATLLVTATRELDVSASRGPLTSTSIASRDRMAHRLDEHGRINDPE